MCKTLIILPLLFFGLQAAASSQTKTVTTEPQLRDDFEKDSRADYTIRGSVGWEAGKLILEEGSEVKRHLPGARDTADIDLRFELGRSTTPAQPAEIVIEFGGFVSWAIRIRQESKEQRPVLEIYLNPHRQSQRVAPGKVFYRSEIASVTNGIQISCTKGQVRISSAGEVIASRLFSSDFYSSWLESIVICSSTGTTQLDYLSANIPNPLSREQERELQAAYSDFQRLVSDGLKDKESAEAAYSKVIKTVGEYHPWSVWMLDVLSSIEFRDDKTRAIELKAKVLKIKSELYGELHPDCLRSLQELADLTSVTGNHDQGFQLGKQSSQYARRAWENQTYFMSDRELFEFRQQVSLNLISFVHSACSLRSSRLIQDPDLPTKVYEEWLNWKGAIQSRQRVVRLLREDSQIADLLSELSRSSSLLAKLSNNHLVGDDASTNEAQRRSENERFDQMQWQIARASTSVGFLNRDITVAELAAALPKDAVLVDFLVNFNLLLAFVITPDASVTIVQLGESAPIGQAIEAWRKEIDERSVEYSAGTRVRQLVWDPIQAHIPAGSLILFSPDGEIGRLPFAALPLNSDPGTYLIETHRLAIVPVPRELVVRNQVPQPKNLNAKRSILLAGGIDFDKAESELQTTDSQGSPAILPSESNDSPIRQFLPLPGSKREVDEIENVFRSVNGSASLVKLTGAQASESNFKREAATAKIIHIASHGYFSSEQASALVTLQSGSKAYVDVAKLGRDAELTSGIVLAGANARVPMTNAYTDDGILSSLEVQAMSLTACDLVTLSACETGLGVETFGEGLLGLQRSFQIAGVGSVIASSWKVDDEVTQLLMSEFYKRWLTGNISKVDALREAQMKLLDGYNHEGSEIARGTIATLFKNEPAAESNVRNTNQGRRLPPRFWAAFSLSGDWR